MDLNLPLNPHSIPLSEPKALSAGGQSTLFYHSISRPFKEGIVNFPTGTNRGYKIPRWISDIKYPTFERRM
jgi:hypothetical protein